jgi:hypothetical protein
VEKANIKVRRGRGFMHCWRKWIWKVCNDKCYSKRYRSRPRVAGRRSAI